MFNRFVRKYDLMFSQRSYIHWFIREGMERTIFAEAREDIGFLEKDYLDVLDEEWDEDFDEDDY